MLVTVGATHLFVGTTEREELTRLVLNGRTEEDFADDVVGPGVDWLDAWDPVARAIHLKVSDHLARQARAGGAAAIERFSKLDYWGDDAKHNVLDILHASSLVSRQLRILPHPSSMAEDVHNRMALGTAWHSLIAEAATVLFNVTPRSRLGWLLNDRYDAEITFNVSDVEAVLGRVTHVSLLLRGVGFSFGPQWTVKVYDAPEAASRAR